MTGAVRHVSSLDFREAACQRMIIDDTANIVLDQIAKRVGLFLCHLRMSLFRTSAAVRARPRLTTCGAGRAPYLVNASPWVGASARALLQSVGKIISVNGHEVD